MKIVLAESTYHADVVGILADESDVVEWLEAYLSNIQLGQRVPHQLKVYEADPENYVVSKWNVLLYGVNREGMTKFNLDTQVGKLP